MITKPDNGIDPASTKDDPPPVSDNKGNTPSTAQLSGPTTTTALPTQRPSVTVYEIQPSTDEKSIPVTNTDTSSTHHPYDQGLVPQDHQRVYFSTNVQNAKQDVSDVLPEFGPDLISGTVTMDDASFTT